MDVLPFSIPDPDDLDAMTDYSSAIAAFVGTHDMPLFAPIWDNQYAHILHELNLVSGSEKTTLERSIHRQNRVITRLIGEQVASSEPVRALKLLGQKLKNYKPGLYFTLLDDLLGEVMPINIPGTIDEYPNWRRKHTVLIEDLVPLDLDCSYATALKSN